MKYSLIIAGEKANERVMKISYALRKCGVTVAGIFKGAVNEGELGRYFDFYRIEPDGQELSRIVQRFPSDFVHLHSYGFDQTCLDILRSSNKKVVYDPKDVFLGIHDQLKQLKPIVDGQHHLLTRSSGLVLRDAQAILSARLAGYKLAPKRILFPDLCWSTDFFPKSIKPLDELNFNALKLVFIGNFWPERQPPHWTGAGQLYNFKELLGRGHSIDVYPTGYMKSWDFSDYYKLENEYAGKFKFMASCSEYELIVKRLPEYDLAIGFLQYGFIQNPRIYWHPSLFRYAMATRIFDFTSAGLLTIISSSQSAYQRFARAGLAINLPIGSLADALDRLPYLVRGAKFGIDRFRAMQALSIDNYINKLLRFYRSV